jgi:hypothetical protein
VVVFHGVITLVSDSGLPISSLLLIRKIPGVGGLLGFGIASPGWIGRIVWAVQILLTDLVRRRGT